ncbi:hypothetical protein [Humibacter antri]
MDAAEACAALACKVHAQHLWLGIVLLLLAIIVWIIRALTGGRRV